MLKFTYPLGLATLALAALPAALNSQSLDGGAEVALANTLAALDELQALHESLGKREAGSIERILLATETPPPTRTPKQQDEFLTTLRREVSNLGNALDAFRSGPGFSAEAPPNRQPTPVAGVDSENESPSSIATTGLDETTRKALAEELEQPDRRPVVDRTKRAFETAGFSADVLRQGRLYFRADRFQDALDTLSRLGDNPEARYWCARSLEALEREDDAAALYRVLIEDPNASHMARRAQHDLDFIEWKQRFFRKAPESK